MPMADWYPIDTAPKDKPILGWGPWGRNQQYRHYLVKFDGRDPSHPWLSFDGWQYPVECITHWKPLDTPNDDKQT